jgi:hypothetical protein
VLKKLSDDAAIAELNLELGAGASDCKTSSLEEWARAACQKTPPGKILSAAMTVVERIKTREKDSAPVKAGRRRGGK